MSLMAIIKFGYALVIITFILMIWASLARALEMHIDTGHPPCLFQALCTCSKPAGDLGIVQCNNVPILRVPGAINTSKVFMLHLQNNRIRELEPHFFQSTGLYKLAINKNPLEEIHDDAFIGLENSLWELELQKDLLTSVPSRSLRYFQKLRVLDLSGNEISEISGENWRGLENTLQILILADNAITNLPSDSFSSLPMLETLDLHGNHLAHVDASVFRDGMHRLNKLLLQDNQLTYIPYEELTSLRQLRYLDLSSNVIRQIPPNHEINGLRMSLDILKLDNNVIQIIYPMSFKYFDVLNTTSLNGNPIESLREDAFRSAHIRSLSLRDCSLTDVSPAAFAGLEQTLQSLDLSENNLTLLSRSMFHRFDSLRYLNLRENKVDTLRTIDTYSTNYQNKLFYFDVSGSTAAMISLRDLNRMRSLRHLAVSKLIRRTLTYDDFFEFGVELEELRIVGSTITKIGPNAFQHVRTIKTLDLSENNIEIMDRESFLELHSLTTLKMANGLADSIKVVPYESLKSLIDLQYLDLSNNRLKSVPDVSFHFLYKLRRLELQDNVIQAFSKGTLQGDIHSQLETIILSQNRLRQIIQHTFVDLKEIKEILIEDNEIDLIQRRAFMNLDNLKAIKLCGNRITDITEEAFQNLPSLKELDISFNRLPTFKFTMFDQVGSATSLKVNASYNRINHLADSIAPSFYPVRSQSLTTDIDTITAQDIGSVSVNIRVLDFSHNNISYIAPFYFRHAHLTLSELYIRHNKLKNISRDVFGSMTQLQYIDLSYNDIHELEYDCFKKTKNLQMVLLSHNHINEVPLDIFHDMQFLTLVDLSNNHIKALADNLFPVAGLERLDVSYNELSRIPTNAISPMAASTIVELDLSNNYIPAVAISDLVQKFRQAEGGQNGDFWLEEEYADEYLYHTARRDHNKVYHYKKSYDQTAMFKSLIWLDLSRNHLVRIEPGSFAALPKLRWLDISDNAPLTTDRGQTVFRGLERKLLHIYLKNASLNTMPTLPFTRLKTLDLSYNNLPSFPADTASNLTKLRKLDLSYNDLTNVPVATHSLNDLRWLSLSGNPITSLTNTSLYGVSGRLDYLDVTRLKLKSLENGVLSKMIALRTLKLSVYSDVKAFNIPRLLINDAALKNLFIDVNEGGINLGREMSGQLPCKLNNITITGRPLKYLSESVLYGVHSRDLHLTVQNTSINYIDPEVFWHPGRVRTLTMDLRGNQINTLPNPSSEWPGIPNTLFLQDILLEGNQLTCDCGIGWVETWERKRRQYLCNDEISTKCLATRGDVRLARCPDNRTLAEVFKTDLECGWSSSLILTPKFYLIMGLCLATVIYI